MTSSYQTLFTITLNHDYFKDNYFTAFTITPLADSKNYIYQKGLLIRIDKGVIKVLIDVSVEAEFKLKQILDDKHNLKFALNLTDINFYNYTDGLTDKCADKVYYLSNTLDSGKPKSGQQLHIKEIVGEDDSKPVDEFADLFFSKPFAVIDICIFKTSLQEYLINFGAKSTYWKYILISNYYDDYDNLSIIEGQEVSFDGPEDVDLITKQKALVFKSKEPIKLSENPFKVFSLIDNYNAANTRHKVLKRALPIPDISTISAATTFSSDNQTNISEIFI